jgi:hypothetical protein
VNASSTRCFRLVCTGPAVGLLLAWCGSANASQLASVGTVQIQSSATFVVVNAPSARLEFGRVGLISRFAASEGRGFRPEPSGVAFLTTEAVGSSPFDNFHPYSGVGETLTKESLAITVTKKTHRGETRQKITSVLAHFY